MIISRQTISSTLLSLLADPRKHQLYFHLAIHLPIILPAIPKYFSPRSGPRRMRAYNYKWFMILPHILLSIFILVRYQYRILTTPLAVYYAGSRPAVETLDLVTGLTNAALGFTLVRKDGRGNHQVGRVGFHALAVHIAMCSVVGYVTQEPAWYNGMVKDHNSFSWARVLYALANGAGPLKGLRDRLNSWGGLLVFLLVIMIAEGNAPFPFGMPAMFAIGLVLMKVENSISSLVTVENSKTNPFVRLCLLVGLVDGSTYKQLNWADKKDGPWVELVKPAPITEHTLVTKTAEAIKPAPTRPNSLQRSFSQFRSERRGSRILRRHASFVYGKSD